jgi:hypothetical protein
MRGASMCEMMRSAAQYTAVSAVPAMAGVSPPG